MQNKPTPCAECDWRWKTDLLMPENAEAWNLFFCVQTQWRAGGMGIVGLDYGELRAAARDMDIPLTPGLWRKIRALEAAELSEMRKEVAEDDAPGGND